MHIGSTISRYKIVEKLGEGGMGVVYKAEDTKLERTVALKFLGAHLLNDAEAKERFLREAKAAAAISHPNICHVYEIDEVDGKTFLAMEFLEGEALEDRIAQGPLALKDALDIARQVADGLQAAHEKAIVHRDIKPANIMIDAKGRATIMDFGLARLTEASRLTKVDTAMGTVAYMSPEQAQGMEVDGRTDTWALGCVLYEMLSGQRPFTGEYDQALLYGIVHEEPAALTGLRTGIPVELELLVSKCLAKDAGNRYQHANEASVDIRRLAEKLKSGRSAVVTAHSASQGQMKRPAEELSKGELAPNRTLRLFQVLFAIAAVAVIVIASLPSRQTQEGRQVRKFSFTPGPLDPLVGLGRAVVSPNGRYIVYVAGGEQTKLWVRELGDEEPRPLEGTEGASAPFWSPDGQHIGFGTARYGQAGGELKRVPVRGGPSTIVCRLKGPFFGGSWSPDGNSIVFSSGATYSLYEVPSRGGESRLLINPNDQAHADNVYQPHFLPSQGGRRVLLFSTVFDSQIFVRDLEAGTERVLVAGSAPVYSPTGQVVYESGHMAKDLWALPFSIETLRAGGEPFPVAVGAASSDPSVAIDGTLVYVSGQTQRQLVWRDRGGAIVEQIGQPQQDLQYPSLSPDGRYVAVKGFEEGIPESDIWILDLAGGSRTRLTSHSRQDSRPVWSPTGRRVAFASHRSGNYDIYARVVDGNGAAEALTANPFREGPADWSAERQFLLFDRVHPESNEDIWYFKPTDDGQGFDEVPFLQPAFSEKNPKLSPNGRFVAYQSDESGRFEIYVKPFPNGDDKWPVSRNGGDDPRWSGDGEELFYVEGASLVAVEVSTDRTFAAGETTHLFSASSLQFGGYPNYDVSADGQRFVVVENVDSAPPRIHIVENWYEEFRDGEE